MERFHALAQKHKLASYAVGLGFIVFINCFGFPVYNLNKEWPSAITALKVCVVLGGAWETGVILAGIFYKKKLRFIALPFVFSFAAGLMCRYLLEFGEVSNVYNFTVPNVVLHFGVFTAVTWAGWLCAVKSVVTK